MANSENKFIPGLHFFCDHRCWRCPLTDRCQVAARMADRAPTRRRSPAGTGPAARVAEVVMASLYVTVDQVGFVLDQAGRPQGGTAPPEPGSPIAVSEEHAPSKAAEKDALVVRAREYAIGSLRVLQALRPRITRRGDAVSLDAADRLEETCISVASKIHRAVSSALDAGADPGDLQGDANGSAKVALILMEESRQAWRALMRPGHAVGNGAPAGFVAALDALEAGLHARFPRAFEFVRPGFDTVEHCEPSGVARALLNTQLTTRN